MNKWLVAAGLGALIVIGAIIIFQKNPPAALELAPDQIQTSATSSQSVSLDDIREKGFEIALISKENKEFFYAYRPNSDIGTQMLFRFDSKKNQYIELRTAFSYLDSNDLDEKSFSPDGTRFLSVLKYGAEGDEKTLYLIDLRTDSAGILKTLSATSSETFVAYHESFAAYPVSEKEWVSNSTVRAKIFDGSKQIPGPDGPKHPIHRTETIQL